MKSSLLNLEALTEVLWYNNTSPRNYLRWLSLERQQGMPAKQV